MDFIAFMIIVFIWHSVFDFINTPGGEYRFPDLNLKNIKKIFRLNFMILILLFTLLNLFDAF